MTSAKARPKHLDVVYLGLRLPVPGIVSILHRISGIVLYLIAIPFLLWALQTSLAGSDGFARVRGLFANGAVKLLLVGFAWAFLHHFFAGIRYLLLDLHWGIALGPARTSSKIVLAVSLLATLLVAVWLW